MIYDRKVQSSAAVDVDVAGGIGPPVWAGAEIAVFHIPVIAAEGNGATGAGHCRRGL